MTFPNIAPTLGSCKDLAMEQHPPDPPQVLFWATRDGLHPVDDDLARKLDLGPDHPDNCTYKPVSERLERIAHERYTAAYRVRVDPLPQPHDDVALASVMCSEQVTRDGLPWLRLKASDGAKTHITWNGDDATLLEAAEEFGLN